MHFCKSLRITRCIALANVTALVVTFLQSLTEGACAVTRIASRKNYSTWNRKKSTLFDGLYLRKRSTLDIAVLGYIVIVPHNKPSPPILAHSSWDTLNITTFHTIFYLGIVV
jgi:hypothetical protein